MLGASYFMKRLISHKTTITSGNVTTLTMAGVSDAVASPTGLGFFQG